MTRCDAARRSAGRAFRHSGPAVPLAAAVLLLLLVWPGSALAQLAKVETHDMRLVYIDPSETYLVPYAARAFLNAMRFHRTLFDYEPREKVTVLLTDFSDYGNASATSVPRNSVQIQIAPMSYVFETVPPSERLAMVMSHELVHVVTMDQATGRDLTFRRLFSGKVNPTSDQPESVLYFYLTTPRVASPRWYLEGTAVFADTWMMGGIGRAQGGYDEMVFRAMVRDQARFYDPLGLVSEGTKIDFQVEANSYLYGTRFMAWLAYQYSPDHLVRWVARAPGSRAYYSSQFREVFETSIEDAWQQWIDWERAFQTENLAAIRRHPVTEATDLSPRALGSVSRAYYDGASQSIFAGLNYPGVVAHIGAISTRDRSVDHIVDIKGPKLYQVTSLAWDPVGRQLFYTTDNGDFRNLVRLDPATGQTRELQKDLRVGDLAFNAADRSLWGIRHLRRQAPSAQDLAVALACRDRLGGRTEDDRHLWPLGRPAARVAVPDRAGLQGHGGRRVSRRLLGPRAHQPCGRHGILLPGWRPANLRAPARGGRLPTLRLDGHGVVERIRLL